MTNVVQLFEPPAKTLGEMEIEREKLDDRFQAWQAQANNPHPLAWHPGTAETLNAQLMGYLRTRRCARAIATREGRWAAIVVVTMRAWVRGGPSPNDFAVISGPLFKDWEERLGQLPEGETLAVWPTIEEAQDYLRAWAWPMV